MNLFALALASCAGPAPDSVTAAVPAPATAIPHAPEIRFALVGQPTDVNAWALFDESGASYANNALHSDEYPRLYRLSIPAREFELYIAAGMPSSVTQEGEYLTAVVNLQDGLAWSDGSPLTARDAAFTVNTALAFDLGFDWLSAYNPAVLDHADAVDDATVKFYFKRPFTVVDWQYGALQGPIVNRAYWSPKLTEAAALLPVPDLTAALEKVKADADSLQARIDADNAQLLTTLPESQTYNELSARITRSQNELNPLNLQLGKLQDEYDAALNAARAALFALDDAGEPTFGPFLRAAQNGDIFTREVNPFYPFEQPNFDRAAYRIFPDQAAAVTALKNAEVNVILAAENMPEELYRREIEEDPALHRSGNPTSSVRFIAINPAKDKLAEPAFRRVLFCVMVHPARRASTSSFIPYGNKFWQFPDAADPCGALRVNGLEVVEFLKSAGYAWQREPSETASGEGLILPDRTPFPPVTLLTPPAAIDPARAERALYIEQSARELGIPLTVKFMSAEDLRYAVYSSGEYDMAILGWRLSAYPGYLCEWFQAPSPFEYGSDRLTSACEALNATADLETARQASFEIQSILMEDLPFIPLYQVLQYEVHRNVIYPFEDVLDGLSGLYGAPSLAVPVQ